MADDDDDAHDDGMTIFLFATDCDRDSPKYSYISFKAHDFSPHVHILLQ